MARNPKSLRVKGFAAWKAHRQERYDTGDLGWIFLELFRSSKGQKALYRAHRQHCRILARYTDKGFRGFNSNGQWLRRNSKRRTAKW